MLKVKQTGRCYNQIMGNIKERMFEVTLILVGLVGLLILFTLLFAGPGFIFNQILKYLNIGG